VTNLLGTCANGLLNLRKRFVSSFEICQEQLKQLVRSSGSVGANYIEAQEALSRKDFKYRVCVARKEARESVYWLRLLNTGTKPELEAQRQDLLTECGELVRILSAIINRTD